MATLQEEDNKAQLDALIGREVVGDATLDEMEADATPQRGSAVDFTKLEVGESPFDDRETEFRRRPGWQQSWVRNDQDMPKRLGWGYKFIRQQLTGKDENGKPIPRQAAGQEKGEKIRKFDWKDPQGAPVYVYAMEVPQELVDAHVRAATFKSHAGLNDTDEQAKRWADGLNSKLGRKKEQVTVESTYEERPDEVHSVDEVRSAKG